MKTNSTKNLKPNFIHGDYLTGKDRSYKRSLYRYEGFDRKTEKVVLRFICFDECVGTKECLFDSLTVEEVNKIYRLATESEIVSYRTYKKDINQRHLDEKKTKKKMKVIKVYDNEGESLDRFTIVLEKNHLVGLIGAKTAVHECIGMSLYPERANGYCQFSECVLGDHLGKEIAVEDLPQNVQDKLQTLLEM